MNVYTWRGYIQSSSLFIGKVLAITRSKAALAKNNGAYTGSLGRGSELMRIQLLTGQAR